MLKLLESEDETELEVRTLVRSHLLAFPFFASVRAFSRAGFVAARRFVRTG